MIKVLRKMLNVLARKSLLIMVYIKPSRRVFLQELWKVVLSISDQIYEASSRNKPKESNRLISYSKKSLDRTISSQECVRCSPPTLGYMRLLGDLTGCNFVARYFAFAQGKRPWHVKIRRETTFFIHINNNLLLISEIRRITSHFISKLR